MVPYADDTAKALTALHLLGCTVQFDALIQKFERKDHFFVIHLNAIQDSAFTATFY